MQHADSGYYRQGNFVDLGESPKLQLKFKLRTLKYVLLHLPDGIYVYSM